MGRKRPLKAEDKVCHWMLTSVMLSQTVRLCSQVSGLLGSPAFSVGVWEKGEKRGGVGEGKESRGFHFMRPFISYI